jgi:hypothetical protein
MTTTEINIPDTTMTLQEVIDEVFARHDAECLRLTEQRDEARREVLAAADEIERLRAENTQLRIERDSYLHSFDVAIGLPDDSEDDSEGDPRVEDHYGE